MPAKSNPSSRFSHIRRKVASLIDSGVAPELVDTRTVYRALGKKRRKLGISKPLVATMLSRMRKENRLPPLSEEFVLAKRKAARAKGGARSWRGVSKKERAKVLGPRGKKGAQSRWGADTKGQRIIRFVEAELARKAALDPLKTFETLQKSIPGLTLRDVSKTMRYMFEKGRIKELPSFDALFASTINVRPTIHGKGFHRSRKTRSKVDKSIRTEPEVDALNKWKQARVRSLRTVRSVFERGENGLYGIGDRELFFSILSDLFNGQKPGNIAFLKQEEGFDVDAADVSFVARRTFLFSKELSKKNRREYQIMWRALRKTSFFRNYETHCIPILNALPANVNGLMYSKLRELGKRV